MTTGEVVSFSTFFQFPLSSYLYSSTVWILQFSLIQNISAIAHIHFNWMSTVRRREMRCQILRKCMWYEQSFRESTLSYTRHKISNFECRFDFTCSLRAKCHIKCTVTMLFILIWVFCFLNACIQTCTRFQWIC